ncbi:MAG: hypothetical protein AMXMBFR13_07040 [Phycisphaerae bacterium]
MSNGLVCLLLALLSGWAVTPDYSNPDRINLAEFARVVEFTGDSPDTLEAETLERGPDGWMAWKGPGGEYMMGLEFDAPRDIAEVNIEFRHAIADRDLIKMQYYRDRSTRSKNEQKAATPSEFESPWATARIADWWAGDRDLSFTFAPEEHERVEAGAVPYYRTRRLRFVLGHRELPPVRYIRAYGPGDAAEGAFELQFEPSAKVRPPVDVSVVNGLIMEADGPDTRVSAFEARRPLKVRYADANTTGPNRTEVSVRSPGSPQHGFTFLPAEVARQERMHIATRGVTVFYRGSVPKTRPSDSRPATSTAPSSAEE